MFCPKCKYTTFDHFSSCPRCGYDWEELRRGLSLDWIEEPSTSEEGEVPQIGEEGLTGKAEEAGPLSYGPFGQEGEGEELSGPKGDISPQGQRETTIPPSSGEEETPIMEEVEVSLDESLFVSSTGEDEVFTKEEETEMVQSPEGEEKEISKVADVGIRAEPERDRRKEGPSSSYISEEETPGEITVDFLFQTSGAEERDKVREEEGKKEIAKGDGTSDKEIDSSDDGVWDIEFSDLEIEDMTIQEDGKKGEQAAAQSDTTSGTSSHKKSDKDTGEIEVLDIVFEDNGSM